MSASNFIRFNSVNIYSLIPYSVTIALSLPIIERCAYSATCSFNNALNDAYYDCVKTCEGPDCEKWDYENIVSVSGNAFLLSASLYTVIPLLKFTKENTTGHGRTRKNSNVVTTFAAYVWFLCSYFSHIQFDRPYSNWPASEVTYQTPQWHLMNIMSFTHTMVSFFRLAELISSKHGIGGILSSLGRAPNLE